jgi:hypothetical protein
LQKKLTNYNFDIFAALPSAAVWQHVPPAPPAAPPPHESGPAAHVDGPGPGGAARVRVRDHRRRSHLGEEAVDVQHPGRVRVTSGPDPAYHPSVAGSTSAASSPPHELFRANTTHIQLIVSFSI